MTRWSSSEHDKVYQCCYCLHVRVGTILFATWKILTQVAVLCLLIGLLINPELFPTSADKQKIDFLVSVGTLGQQEGMLFDKKPRGGIHPFLSNRASPHQVVHSVDGDKTVILAVKPKQEQPSFIDRLFGSNKRKNSYGSIDKRVYGDSDEVKQTKTSPVPLDSSNQNLTEHPEEYHSLSHEDRYVAVAVTLFWLSFSVLLLLGGVSGRPSYLMPFFCLQVFDFVITCLNVVGYFTYLPDIKRWIKYKGIPYKHVLLMLDPACLTFIVMCLGLALLTIKAYLLGMIWSCYKFLVRRATGLESGTGFGPGPRMARLMLRVSPVWLFIRRRTGRHIPVPGVGSRDEWPIGDPEAEYTYLRAGLERVANIGSSSSTNGDPALLRMAMDASLRETDGTNSGEMGPPPPPLADPNEAEGAAAALPKYEEVLQIPANAYMPPPYYRGKFDG